MGYDRIIRGHVKQCPRHQRRERAAQQPGLANVNPIFTWVRLAQRVPVRIQIDELPPGALLSAGMTATVQIDPRPGSKTGEAAVDQTRDPPLPQPTPPQQCKKTSEPIRPPAEEAQRKPVPGSRLRAAAMSCLSLLIRKLGLARLVVLAARVAAGRQHPAKC
jgi:hypothetical protein